ncbi:MAG: FecR domain-containing protein [Chloroflexi bacterium]|nr:MAG: FecR domain-containing protein [Chloroflexota bacterium]
MSAVAAKPAPRRRRGLPWIVALLIILLLVGAAAFWLNTSAVAATNAVATLTVFQPVTSVARGGGAYADATTGAVVQAGDGVRTDAKGRGSIQLPDGTLTRLASNTELTLTSAHFGKDGNLRDASITQKIGRTFTNVQHLVSGATFKVSGQSATATVRGTKFEVYIKADGTMVVKLFVGELDFDGKNHVHLVAPQQATADPQGNIGPAGPIQPDPDDPLGAEMAASDATSHGTTPGTEQDYIGPPLHNGEQQQYSYSFAGGGLVKAALGYPGSSMKLQVKAPDGQIYTGTGTSPVVVVVNNGPAGIYTILVTGVSGLGTKGEVPFVSVAALEPCASANIDQNGAVRRGLTSQDLVSNVQVAGVSNLNLTIINDSLAGAILKGSGTLNGASWTGTVVLLKHGTGLAVVAVGATAFGMNVPAEQIMSQVGAVVGQDPSNINVGFIVDRLFTCKGVVIIDGRAAGPFDAGVSGPQTAGA